MSHSDVQPPHQDTLLASVPHVPSCKQP